NFCNSSPSRLMNRSMSPLPWVTLDRPTHTARSIRAPLVGGGIARSPMHASMLKDNSPLESTDRSLSDPALDPAVSSRAKTLPRSGTRTLAGEAMTFVEHAGIQLHSVFQPIISVVHSRVVGHEALVRGRDVLERPLSPAELFPQLVSVL